MSMIRRARWQPSVGGAMSEKRKQFRKDVAVNLPVVDVNTGRVIGDLANISYAGLMINSKRAFVCNSVFQLSLLLPKPMCGVDTLYFGAECLWCNPADVSGRYWVGFHLIDISPQDLEVLKLFVEAG